MNLDPPLDFGAFRIPPWEMVGAGVAAAEPEAGMADWTVRLGTWLSPEGVPWEVAVARTQWQFERAAADSDSLADPSEVVFDGVPALLLLPRSLARPTEDLTAGFDRWRRALKRPGAVPHWAPDPERFAWDYLNPPPNCFADVWAQTRRLAAALGAWCKAEKPTQTDLRRLWTEAPWTFPLDSRLLHQAGLTLGIPAPLDLEAVLLAARGARMRAGWLDGEVASRDIAQHPKAEAARRRGRLLDRIRASAYHILTSALPETPKQHIAAFLDGVADLGAPISASGTSKAYSNWNGELQKNASFSVLVPLTGDGIADPVTDVPTWTRRWLRDGRALRGLWSTFGREIAYFEWDLARDVPERWRRGLHVLGPRHPYPYVEAGAVPSWFGHRVVWGRAPGRGAGGEGNLLS